MPSRRSVAVLAPACDELLVAASLMPFLETDLRASWGGDVYATDAPSTMAGGCRAHVSDDDGDLFYQLAEERGAYVRLDGTEEEEHQLVDHRPAAAELCVRQRWGSIFCYSFARQLTSTCWSSRPCCPL